jgi:trans-2,3-dihydro-3-hydroxyanthranilate isomerase
VGHPTIGTWWLLAERGLVPLPRDGPAVITQETGAGVLPVEVTLAGGKPTRVVMTQRQPEFGPSLREVAKLGRALGGDARTVLRAPGPQVVSTAMPQLMIPVRSLDVLRNLPSGGGGQALAAMLTALGSDCAMMYTRETVLPGSTVHCRMFAPGLGVPEDPATGSAAGALGAYLVHHGVVPSGNGRAAITIEQGLEIGRPSIIQVEVELSGGAISRVRVGGEAVTLIEGEVRL